MGGAHSTHGKHEIYLQNVVGKPEEKKSLGRTKSGWEDNIGINFRKMNGKVWFGRIWLRIGTSGGLL
jgi:hypothetical protein